MRLLTFIALLMFASPSWSDSTSPTSKEAALITAAEQGRNDDIRKLLAEGVDVNGKYYASTALNSAVIKKHSDTVKLLLDADANPNIPNAQGTPLSHAVWLGEPATVELLLKHGADPKIFEEEATDLTQSLLAELASRKTYPETVQIEMVRMFLRAGVKVDATGNDGLTPLRKAIESNRVAVAKVLLEAGANQNQVLDRHLRTFSGGEVPLQVAVVHFAGDTSMIKLLLDFGANPNYRNDRFLIPNVAVGQEEAWNGITSLSLAANERDMTTVVKLLLDRGADPCLARTDGETPYSIAMTAGNKKIAALILKYAQKRGCNPAAQASIKTP